MDQYKDSCICKDGYKLKKNTHSTELKLSQSPSQKGEPATRKTLSFRKM